MPENAHYGLKEWGKGSLEEGLEEVGQGITSNIVNKAVFDYDKPLWSMEDNDAIINPDRAEREFVGGVVAGGILSGAGAAARHLSGAVHPFADSYRDHLSADPIGRTESYIPLPLHTFVLDDPIIEVFPEAQTNPHLYDVLKEIVEPKTQLPYSEIRAWDAALEDIKREQQFNPSPSFIQHENNIHTFPTSVQERIKPYEKLSSEYIRHVDKGIPTQIGEMNFSDVREVVRELENGEKKIIDLPYECNYTITRDGKVWFTTGEGTVDSSGIPSGLKGSYSYHNHPSAITNYSFSGDDVGFFIEYDAEYSKASDNRYEYVMRKRPDTIKMPPAEVKHRFKEIETSDVWEMMWYGKIDPDLDCYHEVMKILSEELNFDYGRRRK